MHLTSCSSFSLLTVSFCSYLVPLIYLNKVCVDPLDFHLHFFKFKKPSSYSYFTEVYFVVGIHGSFVCSFLSYGVLAVCSSLSFSFSDLALSFLFLSQTSLVSFVPAFVLPVVFPSLHLLASVPLHLEWSLSVSFFIFHILRTTLLLLEEIPCKVNIWID